MKFPYLAISVTFLLSNISHAAAYSIIDDDFESYGTLDSDMNGQGGWVVTNGNPQVPAEGPVVIVDAYTWDASNRSATVGGVEQTSIGITSLSHSAYVPIVGLSGGKTIFSVETAYTESLDGDPRNPYSFILTADSGNLLTINLVADDPGTYLVTYSSAFFTGGTMGILSANTSTQFQLEMFNNGGSVAYSLTNAGSPVKSGFLGGGASVNDWITDFEVTWDSTGNQSGSVGGGSITVDNVYLVPEPSSALLGLLGAAFAFTRRRR